MPHNINPYRPDEKVTGEHVAEMVNAALQEYFQRLKTPHHVEGSRGLIELHPRDLLVIQSIVRAVVNQNVDGITHAIQRDTTGDDT